MSLFSRIIGQRAAKEQIRSLLRGRPRQVYLIAGPEGIGKRMFASAMAKTVLCANPDENGDCGICGPCRYFEAGTHPDYIRLSPQPAEKNIRVSQVRDKIVSDVHLFPQISGRKAYLIEADFLNEEGQNALLKTLEEPPESVIFLLTVTDTDKLLETIRSRSVTISLVPNTEDEILRILSEQTEADENEARMIASVSKGIPGSALRLTGDGSFSGIRETVSELLNDMPVIGYSELLSDRYSFFEDNKDRIGEVLTVFEMGLGDVAMLLFDPDRSSLRVVDKRDNIIRTIQREKISGGSVDRASAAVTAASRAIASNYSFESAVCTMLLSVHKEFQHG
ncbi:MAG: DNA polymerase III subunit [Clostridiaceae bacterium]|nr:DNA polymerase III subunit [Clostridiaceae bacterium]